MAPQPKNKDGDGDDEPRGGGGNTGTGGPTGGGSSGGPGATPDPQTAVVGASIAFHTNDDDKDDDTGVEVYVADQFGVVAALLADVASDRPLTLGHFDDDSDSGPHPLLVRRRQSGQNFTLRELLDAGIVELRISPKGFRFPFFPGSGEFTGGPLQGIKISDFPLAGGDGNDTWRFNFTLAIRGANGTSLRGTVSGVSLNENHRVQQFALREFMRLRA